MSRPMRLWHLSPSVNSIFKHACAAIHLGLHVWFLVRSFLYFHTLYVRTAKALVSARMRSLAWAFAVRLCDKYHNLMSWLKCQILFSGSNFAQCHIIKWGQIAILTLKQVMWTVLVENLKMCWLYEKHHVYQNPGFKENPLEVWRYGNPPCFINLYNILRRLHCWLKLSFYQVVFYITQNIKHATKKFFFFFLLFCLFSTMFSIAWWPSAGPSVSCWLSACVAV